MRRKVTIGGVLILALLGGWWVMGGDAGGGVQVPKTVPLRRGNVSQVVGTTGTLQAVNTVEIGTQVSGVLREILVDFNDTVVAGQVIARLETDSLEAGLAQEEAALAAAKASVVRARVSLEEAQAKLKRVEELHSKNYATLEEHETAIFSVRANEAALLVEKTRIRQSEASVRMAQTNLDHATITSPINGVILNRAVDVGQTVAASLSAPVLFTIAEDLKEMQVEATVDEADIGNIRVNQRVTFFVDAYPIREFKGTVTQIRLAPLVIENVVTYMVLIRISNEDMVLLPGMTANVTVEIARADDVFLVPTQALRFNPNRMSSRKSGPSGGGSHWKLNAGGGHGSGGGRPKVKKPVSIPKQIWILASGKMTKIPIRVGVSDGAVIEIQGKGLSEGMDVITGMTASKGKGPVSPFRLLRGR